MTTTRNTHDRHTRASLTRLVWDACRDAGVSEHDLVLAGHAWHIDVLEDPDDVPWEDVVWAARAVAGALVRLRGVPG